MVYAIICFCITVNMGNLNNDNTIRHINIELFNLWIKWTAFKSECVCLAECPSLHLAYHFNSRTLGTKHCIGIKMLSVADTYVYAQIIYSISCLHVWSSLYSIAATSLREHEMGPHMVYNQIYLIYFCLAFNENCFFISSIFCLFFFVRRYRNTFDLTSLLYSLYFGV